MIFGRTVSASLLVAAACFAATACQGTHESADAQPPHDVAAAPTPAVPATPAPAESAWDAMTPADHAKIMKEQVLPTMKAAFAAFDPKEYPNMKCGTCHGDGVKDHTFKMPNPKLPKLPRADDAAGWAKLHADDAEIVKFMGETVVPKMAAIIGEPPYDPKTGKGFGCFECHTQKN